VRKVDHDIALAQHVVRTLLYYDIFNYPLTAPEVFRYLGTNSVTLEDVAGCLRALVRRKIVYDLGELYSVQYDPALAVRRRKGNSLAKEFYPVARKRAELISNFPFVRGVMASGSLSKGYMDESCDLDFFIITAPGRLWICRTLLVLFKRLFLRNSHKYFCVNYFVDAEHLEIEEKNLFTATELATVLPLYGADYYERLIDTNYCWLKTYFPNFTARSCEGIPAYKRTFVQKCFEGIFNAGGGILERLLMRLTQRRWDALYKRNYNEKDFRIAFKTTLHASKNHPRNFQRCVMEKYDQKIRAFKLGTERVYE